MYEGRRLLPAADQHGDHQQRERDLERLVGDDLPGRVACAILPNALMTLTHGGAKCRFQ